MPDQFSNEYNKLAHYRTTAVEILQETGGGFDYFVSAIGTSGTLMGVGMALKHMYPHIQIVCAHPVKGHYAAGTVVFRTLIHFEASTTGGDSGALVVDSQGRAVGMHILGVAEDRVAFALPMEEMLAKSWPRRGIELVA